MASIHIKGDYWYMAWSDRGGKRHFTSTGILHAPIGADDQDTTRKRKQNERKATIQAMLTEEMARPEPSVIITNRPCCLIKDVERFTPGPSLAIDQDRCTGCRACLRLGCPAIAWQPAPDGKKGKACIDPLLCNGCTVCQQLCKFAAIN